MKTLTVVSGGPEPERGPDQRVGNRVAVGVKNHMGISVDLGRNPGGELDRPVWKRQ